MSKMLMREAKLSIYRGWHHPHLLVFPLCTDKCRREKLLKFRGCKLLWVPEQVKYLGSTFSCQTLYFGVLQAPNCWNGRIYGDFLAERSHFEKMSFLFVFGVTLPTLIFLDIRIAGVRFDIITTNFSLTGQNQVIEISRWTLAILTVREDRVGKVTPTITTITSNDA